MGITGFPFNMFPNVDFILGEFLKSPGGVFPSRAVPILVKDVASGNLVAPNMDGSLLMVKEDIRATVGQTHPTLGKPLVVKDESSGNTIALISTSSGLLRINEEERATVGSSFPSLGKPILVKDSVGNAIPLVVDSNGYLKTYSYEDIKGTVGSSFPTTGKPILVKDPSGNCIPLVVDANGLLKVTATASITEDIKATVGQPFPTIVKPIGVKDSVSGNTIPLSTNNQGLLNVQVTPFDLALAKGEGNKTKVVQSGWYKPADALQVFTAGLYVEQTTAARRSVKCENAQDTNGGTGIWKIRIDFINENDDLDYEEITLAGLTAVNTVKQIKNINSIIAVELGTNKKAEDNVNVYTNINGLGTIFARIPKDLRNDASCKFFVPRNYHFVIYTLYISSEGKGNVYLKYTKQLGARLLTDNWLYFWMRDFQVINYTVMDIVEGPGTVQVWIDPDSGGKDWACNLVGWLEPV